MTQSVGGVSGDLSALFQMCSVATQTSLSLSKFIHSSKLGSDFQLREQAFGFCTFFWFGLLSTAATVRFPKASGSVDGGWRYRVTQSVGGGVAKLSAEAIS